MAGTHLSTTPMDNPACPSCGSNKNVVRMASSLTPFERPDTSMDPGRWYCQKCSHDFEPEIEDEA